MLLVDLVRVSSAVATTRSRLEKRALLADALTRAARSGPETVDVAATWLSGTLRQRRTGVGWRSLSTMPPQAVTASVTITDADAEIERWGGFSGQGSTTSRRDAVTALFGRLTAPEQDFLRALVTGQVRQGALDSVMLDAIAEAADVPVDAVRRAAMFSAPTGPVAVAALTGGVAALADFTLLPGRPVRPMLAGSSPDVAAGVEKLGSPKWVVDTKLDGIRIQVHRHGDTADEVEVFTRSLDEISERLPAIVDVALALPSSTFILDGEALLVAPDGSPRSFQETSSSAASGESDLPLSPFFFDLLHLDGDDLLEQPLATRLERLDALVPSAHRIPRLATASVDEAATWFDDVVTAGQEGVILKRPDAPYDAGRRGSAWIKVKPRHTFDLVVLAVEWGSGRRRGKLSNIHLGARGPDGLVMVGKTFKGMTDQMLAWQTERFAELATTPTDGSSYVVELRPEQVVEIAIDGVQRSTRYPGGVALRFARVLRYRDDKTAADTDTIETLQALLR